VNLSPPASSVFRKSRWSCYASAKEPRSLRGFNVAHASGGGMDFLAVSDVNADVLGAFVARLAAGSPAR
jgi:hypothetical protein